MTLFLKFGKGNAGVSFISVLFLIFGATCFIGCGPASTDSFQNQPSNNGKIKVCTSLYPLYDFTKKIAGDTADVVNLIPPGIEVHDWEPDPRDMVRLVHSNLFVYNGLGMERWAEKVIESAKDKSFDVCLASEGVQPIAGGCEHNHNLHAAHADNDAHADHDDCPEHGEKGKCKKHTEHEGHTEQWDPHVWLSPKNAIIILTNIKNALIKIAPQHADLYEANYRKTVRQCEELDAEFLAAIGPDAPLASRDIVVSHQAFGYLCKDYGLSQIAIEGLAADSEPTPARMAAIIDEAKQKHVRVIFFEELADDRLSQTIAQSCGARVDVLNPYGGLTRKQIEAGDDYFTVMRRNLAALKRALTNP